MQEFKSKKATVVILIVLIVGAGALAFYFSQSSDETENLAEEPSESGVLGLETSWLEYINNEFGYRLSYPDFWILEANTSSQDSITFFDPQNFGEDLTVAIADPEVVEIIKDSIEIIEETQIEIAGRPATRLVSLTSESSRKNNIVVVEFDERLYYIAGTTSLFDQILATFEFINN